MSLKKILSLALVFVLVISQLGLTAFAVDAPEEPAVAGEVLTPPEDEPNEPELEITSTELELEPFASNPFGFVFDIGEGDISIDVDSASDTLMVTYGDGETVDNIPAGQMITITGTTEEYGVTVGYGVSADITLDGVSIERGGSSGCAFCVYSESKLNLTLVGSSTLKGAKWNAGLVADTGAELTIGGGGSLDIVGGSNGGDEYENGGSGISGGAVIIVNSGRITATGNDGWGAGVGIAGTLIINGGEVFAIGGNGGWRSGVGVYGTLYMTGGSLTAIGGGSAKDIVEKDGQDILSISGEAHLTLGGNGVDITRCIIRGGTVVGAVLPPSVPETLPEAINVADGNVTILPGTVSGTLAVAFGGDKFTDNLAPETEIVLTGTTADYSVAVANGVSANVTLYNLKVQFDHVAMSDNAAFAILRGADVNLTLTGDNELISGDYCAGLQVPLGACVTIDGDGELLARASSNAGGISGALATTVGVVTINGGTIRADGGRWCTGICITSGGLLTINGGTLIATGDGGNPGIGVRNNVVEYCGTVVITGGTVYATGGDGAAGIGGGEAGYGGDVTITGGRVYTTGSDRLSCDQPHGYDIGSGAYYGSPAGDCGGILTVRNAILFMNINGTNAEVDYINCIVRSGSEYWYYDENGDSIELSGLLDISGGNIAITNGTAGTYTVTQNDITISDAPTAKPVAIIGESTQYGVTVSGTAQAGVFLWNTDIQRAGANDCAFWIKDTSKVNLLLAGDNTLKSGDNCAGLQLASGAALTIDGTGSLLAKTGRYGAGIGGGLGAETKHCGAITINGGSITAVGVDSNGAGIGGGFGGYSGGIVDGGTCGNTTINGGTVTAYGNAGIGGGNSGSSSSVTITGGVVTANGIGNGAGIGGGGSYGGGGTITISGGSVTASGTSWWSPGIGGNGGTINISGGEIKAYGSVYGSGIGTPGGSTYMTSSVAINISGGNIFARGGRSGGAGINPSSYSSVGSVNITGGTVVAHGGGDITASGGGAGIGGRSGYKGSTVAISGAQTVVRAKAGAGAYDIGSGFSTSVLTGGSLTVSGGARVYLEHNGTNADTPSYTDCTVSGAGFDGKTIVYTGSTPATTEPQPTAEYAFNVSDGDIVIDCLEHDFIVSYGTLQQSIRVPRGEITITGATSTYGIIIKSSEGYSDKISLLLNNIDIQGDARFGQPLLIENEVDVDLKFTGANTIGTDNPWYSGISIADGVELVLNEANSGTGNSFNVYGSYGIYGSITMDGGEINISGANGGLYCPPNGKATINGGVLNALSTTGDAGICVEHNAALTVNGGTVTASGGYGSGIRSSYNAVITINDGTVTAVGGDDRFEGGMGITVGGRSSLIINGGSVTATGGSGEWMGGFGIYAYDGAADVHISITGGTVDAYGGSCEPSPDEWDVHIAGVGIFCNGTITISGEDTLVTATGYGDQWDIFGSDDDVEFMFGDFGEPVGALTVSDGALLLVENNGVGLETLSFTSCTVDGAGAGVHEGTYDEDGYFTLDITSFTAAPASGAGFGGNVELAVSITVSRKTGPINPAPTGEIEFKYGSTVIDTVAIESDGTASTTWLSVPAGNHTLTATYIPGDDDMYAAGTAGEIADYNVAKAAQTALSITPVTGKSYGDAPFALSVSGGSSTGTLSYTVTSGDAVTVASNGTVTIVGVGNVTITVTKAGDSNYNETSAAVSFTISPAALSGTVTIDGTPNIGSTLTANVSALNASGNLTYQWKLNGADIDDETAATYTVCDTDAGKSITVTVTAGGNHSGAATSASVTAAYTIRLVMQGASGDDEVYFGAPDTTETHAASGAVTISYILDGIGSKSNAITYSGGTVLPVNVAGSGSSSYTVSAADANSGVITITARFTHVNKAQVSVNEAPQAVKYDGTARAFVVSGTPAGGYSVTYSPSSPIDVGSYNVIIHRDADSDYEACDKTITGGLVITKRTLSAANATIAAPSTGGTPESAATAVDTGYAVTGVSWNGAPSPFSASTAYTVTLTLTADGNHEFSTGAKVRVNGQTAAVTRNPDGTLTAEYTFPPTTAAAVTGIAVLEQPDNLTYLSGDKLSLDGLVVTVTYSDTTSADIPFDELDGAVFTINSAAVSHGATALTSAANSKAITISYGGETDDTLALTVGQLFLTLAPAIGAAAGDDVLTALNAAPYDAGELITINYTLNGPALQNELRFDKGLPTVRVAEAGAVSYRVSRADADGDGLIMITPTFVHDSTMYSASVKVTPPVKGALPEDTLPNGAYYDAAISWNHGTGAFDGGTEYTATITLTKNGVGARFANTFKLTVNGVAAIFVSNNGDIAVFKYEFPTTAESEVMGIALDNAPNLSYNVGEKLDLSGLELTVNYDTGTPDTLTPANAFGGALFEIDGIAVADGAVLYSANDGAELTVSFGGRTLTIGYLTVYTPPNIRLRVVDITDKTATIEYSTDKGTAVRLLDEDDGDHGSGALSAAIQLSGLTAGTEYKYTLRVDDGELFERTITFMTLASTGITVGGSVTDSSQPQSIVVTIERGNTVMASVTANRDSNYEFEFVFDRIANGVYNVVADNGSYKVTRAIEIKDDNYGDIHINMDTGKTQSIVEIKSEQTPPAAVGGLPELFTNPEIYTPEDAVVVNGKGTVELKLVAEKQEEPDAAGQIKSEAGTQSIGLFIDLSVYKSHFTSGGELTHTETVKDLGENNLLVITFELPAELKGKIITVIYRAHNGEMEKLTTEENGGGEFFEQNGDLITIHAYKFSTYALAYTESSPPPIIPGGTDDKREGILTDKRIANIDGKGGGLFAPDEKMSRAEVAQMLYNLLRDKDVKIEKTFPDVSAGAWYAKAVGVLATLEVIKGYEDGLFRPEADITRAEFTAMMARLSGLNESDVKVSFTDLTETHWAYGYISAAANLGWINGYPDGSFAPDAGISRAEAVTVMNRVLGRVPDKAYIDAHPELNPFTDVAPGFWAYYDIVEAACGSYSSTVFARGADTRSAQ